MREQFEIPVTIPWCHQPVVDFDVIFHKNLNYRHGTGHGIGAYLKVHEGPTYISSSNQVTYPGKLQPNIFFSDEPGYYKEGEYGIR